MFDRYLAYDLKLKYFLTRIDEGLWWGRNCGEAAWGPLGLPLPELGGQEAATFQSLLGIVNPAGSLSNATSVSFGAVFPLEVIACAVQGDGLNSTKLTRLSASPDATRLTYLPDETHQGVLFEGGPLRSTSHPRSRGCCKQSPR